MNLPLDFLRTVALDQLRASEASPLFVTISGAHLYEFASPDSDFDIRGAHLLPLSRIVSLNPVKETIELSAIRDGREIDLVTHDAAKFFRLMLKKNGYVMEQIFSPLIVIGGENLDRLREIAKGCISRHLYHHYRGFSETQLRLLEKEPVKKVKTLLYAYRVLLTGIHVLRSGEIESSLLRLTELYPQLGVGDLIAAKTREAAPLSEAQVMEHEGAIAGLRQRLDDVFADSRLDEHPRRADDLDEFLVELRLSERA